MIPFFIYLKDMLSKDTEIVITCAPKISSFLAEEVRSHGYEVVKQEGKSVITKGSIEDCYYLNLHLRTANRVMLLIEKFDAPTEKELYSAIKKIEWEEIIPIAGFFAITSYVFNDTIKDTRFANLRVKDAVVDRFYEKMNRRPNSGNSYDKTVLFLHWFENKASIYLDTSGETISKHGYRERPFKAPLMESLACAMIMASGWDKKSPFINPMCGSGTLAIEAALIAMNYAPGLFRDNFGFMHVKGYDSTLWSQLKSAALLKIDKSKMPTIVASDHSDDAMSCAIVNAKRADVKRFIKFQECDFKETNIPEEPGTIILNPEYGERLGKESELGDTYMEIGDFFKQSCTNYTGFVFTGNMSLAKRIGLTAAEKIDFNNGRIDCRMFKYEMYEGSKK